MRFPWMAVGLAFLLLPFVPGAQGAINQPRDVTLDFPFMDGLGGDGPLTVSSGRVEATSTGGEGSYGFFDSKGFTVSGLDKVCYGAQCTSGPGPFALVVPTPGSAALCFPRLQGGTLEAGHVLGLFSDLSQDENLNTFPVGPSLVAPAVDGTFRFSPLATIASSSQVLTQPCDVQGGLAALDEQTRVHVRQGTQTITTLAGKDARFAFTGRPAITDIVADFYILPFEQGATARFTPASPADARQGLELGRVQDLIHKLDAAHAGTNVDREPQPSGGDSSQRFLAGLLNGALLRTLQSPGEGESIDLAGASFVRFAHLDVASPRTLALDWDAHAYLEVQDGKVQGAQDLVGVWIFQLPWWSYLLWAAAFTVAIVRLVLKPVKDNPRWDRLRWIGWAATPVAWVLVFFLIDLETHAILGASLLRDSFGQFRLVVGLVQLALLGFVGLACAAPLRVGLRNTFLLAKQGTFMGLAGCIGVVVGFFATVWYLRGVLGVLLDQVLARLA